MKNWIRVIILILILVGGTVFFRYWSLKEFNSAFDNIDASYYALSALSTNTFSLRSSDKSSELITEEIATSSQEALAVVATSTELVPFFTSPQNGDEVHIGCTYQISWQPSIMVDLFEIDLIDTNTEKPLDPETSGLSRENIVKKDLQNLDWKVGAVLPGEYYLKSSKINGVDTDKRSGVFIISKISEKLSSGDKVSLCKKI